MSRQLVVAFSVAEQWQQFLQCQYERRREQQQCQQFAGGGPRILYCEWVGYSNISELVPR